MSDIVFVVYVIGRRFFALRCLFVRMVVNVFVVALT